MTTTRSLAQRAGLLYLLLGVSAPLGLMVVPSKIIVRGDAAATAERLRTLESWLRAGIASELFHQAVCVFLVLALYRLFKPVNAGLARQLVALGAFVSVPIVFVNVLNELAALMLAKGAPFLAAVEPAQRDAFAYLFLRLHGLGIDVASVFWGLWLFPFGLLVIRSGFIPRVFGWLLLVAGAGYVAAAIGILVAPAAAPVLGPVAEILEFAEIPIIFWLAIWGARGPSADAASEAGA